MRAMRTVDGRLQARFYPKDGRIVFADVRPDGSDVRVYIEETARGPRAVLLAYLGTAGRPSTYTTYREQERAIEAAKATLGGLTRHKAMLEERKAKRASWATKLQVGSVLRHSWGYDQTNIDYYEVVELPGPKTCSIRKIAARSVPGEAWMTGYSWPLVGEYIGEPVTKRIGEGDAVKICDWGSWAYPWVPKADRWTAYA